MRGRPTQGRKSKKRTKAAKATPGRSAKSKKTSKSRAASKAAAKRKTRRKQAVPARKKAASRSSVRSGRGRERKQVFGEGNYTASREFRREQSGFVSRNRNRIPQMGEEAAEALDGSEGNELRRAEDTARSHSAVDED